MAIVMIAVQVRQRTLAASPLISETIEWFVTRRHLMQWSSITSPNRKSPMP